jgi:hypothetical protein
MNERFDDIITDARRKTIFPIVLNNRSVAPSH